MKYTLQIARERLRAAMKQFIQQLPKVELHLHIEGSLEPELMFELAKRNQIDIPFSSPEVLVETILHLV